MKSVLILISFIALPALAQESVGARVLTYESLPQLVRERNENVLAAQTSAQAQKERTGYLRRSFLPEVELRAGHESAKWDSTTSYDRPLWGVEGRVNLYRGGRDRIEEDIRRARLDGAKLQASKEYQSELLEARKTYWQLVAIGKVIAETKEAIKKNTENIKSARRRTGAGVATNADTVEFELESTLLNQQLKKMTLEEDLLRSQFATAIALDTHKSIAVNLEFPHPSEELPNEEEINPQDHIDVKSLEINKSIASLRQNSASRWWLPSVDAYSSYSRPALSSNDMRAIDYENQFIAGIQVTFPLGQAFEDRASGRAQSLEAQSTSLRAAHRSREVAATNHELLHDLRILHELIHDSEENIKKATFFLKLTRSEYARGVKNGPDLLDAFTKYYNFKVRSIDLHRSYQETLAELQYHSNLGDI